MARKFHASSRKTRMWITVGGYVTPANGAVNFNLGLLFNSGSMSQSGADEIATFVNGGTVGDSADWLTLSRTLYATREFTIGAAHVFANFADQVTITERRQISCGALGLGVQGGGSAGVSDLPCLMDNANTGIWPVVVPLVAQGVGGEGASASVIYTASGQSKAQRKVKLGQSIYGSFLCLPNALAATQVVMRLLILL